MLTAEDLRRDALKTQQIEAQQQQANRDLTPLDSYSRGPSMDRGSVDPEATRRVLRIKRLVDGHWETEIVRDPAVIRAYIRNRQAIEEENTLTDSLAPTGDADKDKRAKKRYASTISLEMILLIRNIGLRKSSRG